MRRKSLMMSFFGLFLSLSGVAAGVAQTIILDSVWGAVVTMILCAAAALWAVNLAEELTGRSE